MGSYKLLFTMNVVIYKYGTTNILPFHYSNSPMGNADGQVSKQPTTALYVHERPVL